MVVLIAVIGLANYGEASNRGEKVEHYPGVVTPLIEDSKISSYPPPYNAHHTFITITAWANKGDTSAVTRSW